MKDRLERFVASNREEFDELEPRSDLWLDISLKLLDKEEVSRPIWFRQTFWRYAAAVVILLSIGLGIYQLGRYTQRQEMDMTAVNYAKPLNEIDPELARVESYYTSLISEQKQQLNDKALRDMGLQGDFSRDLVTLDSSYVRLKRDLYKGANKDQIVNAMIQNLQLRSEIIQRQIQTLNQIKTIKETRQDEKVDI